MTRDYNVLDKTSGRIRASFDTLYDAEACIAIFEIEDDCNNEFTQDRYNIVGPDGASRMHPDGRKFYDIQAGPDYEPTGYGSYLYSEAYDLAKQAHRDYPDLDIHITRYRDKCNKPIFIETVFTREDVK